MVKNHYIALSSACLLLLISVDRAVAANVSGIPSGISSLDARSVDSITNGPQTSDEKIVQPAQLPVHPSFSAHYRYQHQPTDTVLDEARVLYSDAGLRVEQRLDHSANVFIVNYIEEKFWFIDRQRQLVHAIPVVVSQNASKASILPVRNHSAGFIQLSPCPGLDGKRGATELWQGRSVQHWTCLNKGELVEEQWYAPIPGVVVRSRTTDGYVSELTDLRERETSSQNFQPPSHFHHVTIEELMNPAVPIGSYNE